MKKVIIWAILIILAVILAIAIFGSYLPEIDGYIIRKRSEGVLEQYKKDVATREAELRADTMGGKTPEETVRLFVEALRQKDAVTASKYYEIDSQEKILKNLKKDLITQNNFDGWSVFFDDTVSKGVKACSKPNDSCTYDLKYTTLKDETVPVASMEEETVFIPAGTERTKSVSLKLNELSRVWKINAPVW